jgi:hypothetical protein
MLLDILHLGRGKWKLENGTGKSKLEIRKSKSETGKWIPDNGKS